MSISVPVCAACGAAVFPPRAVCPNCGGLEWDANESDFGTVEEVTESGGVRIATVRADLGPILIALLERTAAIGDIVKLDLVGREPSQQLLATTWPDPGEGVLTT